LNSNAYDPDDADRSLRTMGLDPDSDAKDKMEFLNSSWQAKLLLSPGQFCPNENLIAHIGDWTGLRFLLSFGSDAQSNYVEKTLANQTRGSEGTPTAFQILAFVVIHASLDLLQNFVTLGRAKRKRRI